VTVYLTAEDLVFFGGKATGAPLVVRDWGLVESALHRPQATAFGQDAYPDMWSKAAALLQSIATNHALVDGNKRTALACTYAFLSMNGQRLTLSQDAAVDLVLAVATGELADVAKISEELRRGTRPL